MTWRWSALLVCLLVSRLPSLVQPAGGDQGLYAYAGQRILAGDVMYRDVWDQKPPGIPFFYAFFSLLWRGESIVPGADLAVAALVACLLVLLGRYRFSTRAGFLAAALFLLLGDPYLQRLSGIYIRAQCEPFIALAIAGALVLLAVPQRNRGHLIGAGAALGIAFWLKYNAATYALPIVAAAWAWRPETRSSLRSLFADLAWIALGAAIPCACFLLYFAVNGALLDLRLATIDYNLRYSNETYAGPFAIIRYVLTMPFMRARIDLLWFLGGLGVVLLVAHSGRRDLRTPIVVLSWILAAVISIALNGSRGLPNYFVQANPALALAAGAGLASLSMSRIAVRLAVAALIAAALCRVGSDEPFLGMRLASVPGLVRNIAYDLRYIRGDLDRETYLERFKGQKHDALENERLARHIRDVSAPGDRVFVFGFSGGSVGWKSQRASPSRFFWSRPIIIEFAADHPGYGTTGLLGDLQKREPVLVALQKEEWRSREFFMNQQPLREWLMNGYVPDQETAMFSVWRRKN